MPAVAPISPNAARRLLEAKGYRIIKNGDGNWLFAKGDSDEPVVVPNMVDMIPLEIALHIARKVGFNDYFWTLNDAHTS